MADVGLCKVQFLYQVHLNPTVTHIRLFSGVGCFSLGQFKVLVVHVRLLVQLNMGI